MLELEIKLKLPLTPVLLFGEKIQHLSISATGEYRWKEQKAKNVSKRPLALKL